MMKFLHNFVLIIYRTVAIVTLYGVLIGVLGYVSILGFYAVDTNWIAPTKITPTDQISLGVTDRLVTSRNAIATLMLDQQRQHMSISTLHEQRDSLAALEVLVEHTISEKHKQDEQSALKLETLYAQKNTDNARTEKVVSDVRTVESRIKLDLKAGLITKADAAQAETQLNQAQNSLTDGKIEAASLYDNLVDKTTADTGDVEAIAKKVDLQSQIATLDMELQLARKQIDTDTEQIQLINQATSSAANTPYFRSTLADSAIDLAFVPYDNQKAVDVGAPVYDCYLNFVACRNVGTVKYIFPNEQKLQNPIFKSDMRGFLVQLDLTDQSAARSKTLFVGSKPLGI
jgi:hypothetical protein